MQASNMTKMFAALVFCMALAGPAFAAPIEKVRLTAGEITGKETGGSGAGTSGAAGIQTTILLGDPTKPGLYTIRLSIPANTKNQAHTHRDDRSAVVMSGTWYFGYGNAAYVTAVQDAAPGRIFPEASCVAHFA